MLAAFLEKDNLKLLVYKGKTRQFAGQITFAAEVLRDAFIAEPAKFSAQLKVAFAQKPQLRDETDVVLFLPPDKTFTKTLDAADGLDSFVQSLPYFKEELILDTLPLADKSKVTHLAFEKKLVEDLERPFLESGKKVVAVRSLVNDLVAAWPQEGDAFLFLPLEKDVAFATASNGGVLEASEFKNDLFISRFGEFVVNHNLSEIKKSYSLGVFPKDLAEKLHHTASLSVESLDSSDVYDLAVAAYLKNTSRGLDFSGLVEKLPKGRKLFLVGAAIVGFLLVVAIVKKLPGLLPKKAENVSPVATETAKPAPEPKPADYKVRVLNGTLVEGEAGRAAEVLKAAGFDVVETKNATSSGFVTTKLRVASAVPDKITSQAKTLLEQTYQMVFVEPLASDSAGVSIEVIIGKKK